MSAPQDDATRHSRMIFILGLVVFVAVIVVVAVVTIVTTDRDQGFVTGQAGVEEATAKFIEAANDGDEERMRSLVCADRTDDPLLGLPTPPIVLDGIIDLEVDGVVAHGIINFDTTDAKGQLASARMDWIDDDGWKLC